MQNGEPNVWTGLAILRNGQIQRRWFRIQILIVFNTIAIPILYGTNQPLRLRLAISAVGFFLHILLLIASQRGERLIRFYTRKMVALERMDRDAGAGEKIMRIQVFSDPAFDAIRRSGHQLYRLLMYGGIVVVLIWLVFTVLFGLRLLTT